MKKLQRHMQLFGLCALMALPAPDRPKRLCPCRCKHQRPHRRKRLHHGRRTRTAPQEHSKCGRQRGDVYNDLRAAGGGFRNRTSAPTIGRRPGADEGAPAAATRPGPWKWCGSSTGIMNCVIPGRRFQGICGLAWCRGPAPAFQPVLRRDELPPEVIALEGFSEILSNYYQEQKNWATVAASAADL